MGVCVGICGIQILINIGIFTGVISLLNENGKVNTKVVNYLKYLNLLLGIVSMVFVCLYIDEGWTNTKEGSGIEKFHEKCTDLSLGSWAYAFLIFFTAVLSLAGAVLLITCCCLCLICGLASSSH